MTASARRPSPGTALVTGASGGIGAELLPLFARDGWDLVLVARGTAAMQAIADRLSREHGIRATVIGADLARDGAADALVAELEGRGVQVDALVNNAGFTVFGPYVDTDAAAESEMLRLNVVTLTELTKRLLPPMVRRGRGHVLNVASTAAFQPGPLMAVYYATKAYVLSFSEALAEELAGTGVTVTALCPGPTQTGFQARGRMESSGLLKLGLVMRAAPVARAGYDGMRAGRRVVVPGVMNKLFVQSVRAMPRRLATWVVKTLQKSR